MLVTAMLIDGPEDCLQFEVDTNLIRRQSYTVYVPLYEPPIFIGIKDESPSKLRMAVYSARIEKGEFVFVDDNLIFDYVGER